MKTSTCGSHSIQLTRLGISNCYLVRESDGLTLVDTSWRGSAGGIIRVAKQLGLPIRRILLTHAHHDHAGSVDQLLALLPDVELCLSEREAALLANDFSRRPGEPSGRLRRYLFEHSHAKSTRFLADGDTVESLEVLSTPGHTPGHLAFLDRRDGTILAGDAFIAVGELFVTTQFVWRFPFPALSGTWHGPTALESAKRIAGLDCSRIATGHGRVVEDPSTAISDALRSALASKAWG